MRDPGGIFRGGVAGRGVLLGCSAGEALAKK